MNPGTETSARHREAAMSEEQKEVRVEMEQLDEFEFRVKFGIAGGADLLMDEPEPLGHGAGPNASRVLAAAVGNCLTASLLFCARKTRTDLEGLRTEAIGRLGRNEQNRWRLEEIAVRIHVSGSGDQKPGKLNRCLALFEDYCVVTASVRRGIPVKVEVLGQEGETLFGGNAD